MFSKKLPFLPDINFSFLDLFDHPGTVFYAVFMSFWGEFSLTGFDNVFFGGNFLVLSYLDISKQGLIIMLQKSNSKTFTLKNTYFTGMLFLKVLNAYFLHCQVGLIISDIACREKSLSFSENYRGFFKRAKNKCNNSLTQFYYRLNTRNSVFSNLIN